MSVFPLDADLGKSLFDFRFLRSLVMNSRPCQMDAFSIYLFLKGLFIAHSVLLSQTLMMRIESNSGPIICSLHDVPKLLVPHRIVT